MVADIVWKTVTLPPGVIGSAYEAGLASNGALSAITASAVASGSLPPGLALSADFVRIVGTPTTAGTYTFTLSLTDTGGSVTSGSLSITINHSPDAPGSYADDLRYMDGRITVPVALARQWPGQYPVT